MAAGKGIRNGRFAAGWPRLEAWSRTLADADGDKKGGRGVGSRLGDRNRRRAPWRSWDARLENVTQQPGVPHGQISVQELFQASNSGYGSGA